MAGFVGETNIVRARVVSRGEGVWLCEAEGGWQVKVRAHPRVEGDAVLLSLRPEKIRISRAAPAGDNVFPARIGRKTFKGAVNELTLRAASGLELGALRANDGESGLDFQENEQVFFRVPPGEISMMSA